MFDSSFAQNDTIIGGVSTQKTALQNLTDIENTYDGVTTEQAQEVITAEREIAKDMYSQKNLEDFNNIFPKTKQLWFRTVNVDQPEIIYSCKYAPNVEMVLTKQQINSLINNNSVSEILLYEQVNLNNEEVELSSNENIATISNANSTTYDTSYFSLTGISTARDAWGLSGTGIKIGIYDAEFSNPNVVDYFNGTSIDYSLVTTNSLKNTYYTHGSYMACLIGGKQINTQTNSVVYKGAVPNAQIFCTAGYGYKYAIENLISMDCNVINVSMTLGSEQCEYTDISKWYDHISYMHKVHFINAAGNYGQNTVCPSGMAYNVIVVGNCYNTGIMKTTSSYTTSNLAAYKPDVIAPGANAEAPPIGTQISNGGTSAATAITSGAVAQLCQASAVLRLNPPLMKAVILSSSKRSYDGNTYAPLSNANNDNIALNHLCGTGLLNVATAFTSAIDSQKYKKQSFSAYSTMTEYNLSISNISSTNQKTIRFCLIWDKPNTIFGDHLTSMTSSPDLDCLKLTITTPSGTIYQSNYLYDTKQVVSFVSTESGTYKATITRASNTSSNLVIDYALAYSTQ